MDFRLQNGKLYILAIAAQKITSSETDNDIKLWSNAKEWLEEWNKYLRNVPIQVSYIASDTKTSLQEKEEGLKKLGVMALPYIKNEINNGHTELTNCYTVISNTINIDAKSSFSIEDMTTDTADEKIIRNMVEAVNL